MIFNFIHRYKLISKSYRDILLATYFNKGYINVRKNFNIINNFKVLRISQTSLDCMEIKVNEIK